MKRLSGVITFIFVALASLAQENGVPMHQQTETETKTLAVLWQQESVEYRALCYQAFNLATWRINQIPENDFRTDKLALITDLDETILDNSYSDAQLIKDRKEHTPASWKTWTDQSAATGVPGAVEFLQFAKQKGMAIFYISNRDSASLPNTILNLKKLNLPDADTAHVLLLINKHSSKEERRNKVESGYKVIMLLGDNLNDFAQAFEKKNMVDRFNETDKIKSEWGNKFIVLPNSTYGEWENALYNYQKNLTPAQKSEMRTQLLKGF